jgi:tRNA-dihydrouridine synthase
VAAPADFAWALASVCTRERLRRAKEALYQHRRELEQLEALLEARGEKGLRIARKHLGWTCQGFAGAAELRHGLMRAGTPEATRELLARAADGFGSSRP